MPTILIAEDEAHIIRVMSLWLTRHGHDIVEAANGEIAIERLRTESVDVIISDMNMPVMDGLELARAVREDLRLNIPFVLLTARCDQDCLAERLKPYQVHIFPKPFVPSRLVSDIDRLLGTANVEGTSI